MEYNMILLDNSDYSRNGDYIPSRWEAQIDSTYLISNTKLTANQESAIGLITLAGQQPQVLLTPTNEDLKIQASLYGVKQQGKIHFKNALSIAYLALKHRKNSNARQRITVFVASPVEEDEQTLVKFAKQLKKNSVAVDLINLGEMEQNHISKLQKFIETVNQSDNSHFLSIEPGVGRIEDKLIGTPFLGAQNEGFGAQAGGAGDMGQLNNQFAEWGGVNPQEDPELAEIMRISLLEAEQQKKKQEEDSKKQKEQQEGGDKNKMEEEQQQTEENKQNIEEQELIDRANEITQPNTLNDKKEGDTKQDDAAIQDPQFMSELLNMIPNVDKNDPKIQEALAGNQKKDEDKKDDKDKKDDDKK